MQSSPEISIASLRRLNSYEFTGQLAGSGSGLEEIILQHLATVAALRRLNAYEEVICRMVAEGYETGEIARETGLAPRSVQRMIGQIRWSLYGLDWQDALGKR